MMRSIKAFSIALIFSLSVMIACVQIPFIKHHFIQQIVSYLFAPHGISVVVDGVRGVLPFRLKVNSIHIMDELGDLAKMKGLRVDFSPFMLLKGLVQIRSVNLDSAEWVRANTITSKMPLKNNTDLSGVLSVAVPRILNQRLLKNVTIKTLKTPIANLSLHFHKHGIESLIEVKSMSDNLADNQLAAVGTFRFSPKENGAIAILYINDSNGIFSGCALSAKGQLDIKDLKTFQPVGTISVIREMQETKLQFETIDTDTRIRINRASTLFECDMNINQILEQNSTSIKNLLIRTADLNIKASGMLTFNDDAIDLTYDGDNTRGVTLKGALKFNIPDRKVVLNGTSIWQGIPIEFIAHVNDVGTNTNLKDINVIIDKNPITLESKDGICFDQKGGLFTLTAYDYVLNGKASFNTDDVVIQLLSTWKWARNSTISLLLNKDGAKLTGGVDVDFISMTEGRVQGAGHIKIQADDALTGAISCALPSFTVNGITYGETQATLQLNKGEGVFSLKIGNGEAHLVQGIGNGQLSLNTKRIALNAFQLSFENHLIALATPFQFNLHDPILPNFSLNIDAHGKIKCDSVSKHVVFENVPLLAGRIFYPSLEVDGILNGSMNVQSLKDQWKGQIQLTQIRPYSSVAHNVSDDNKMFLGFSCGLQFERKENQLLIDLFTKRNQVQLFKAKGVIGLDAQTLLENIMDVHLTGQLDVSLVCSIFNIPDRLGGIVDTHLNLKGKISDIQLFGHVNIKDGLYDSADNGTYIAHIEGTLKGEGRKLVIQTLKGNDLRELNQTVKANDHLGTLDITGFFEFIDCALPNTDLKLKLDDLIVVHRDDMTIRATGSLQMKGPGLQSKITGSVHLTPSLIMLEEFSKDKILSVDIENISSHKEKKKKAENPVFPIDLELLAVKNFYIRDLDLSLMSQWTGKLMVKGNLSDPFLEGTLNIVHGKFSFFGKQLKISEAKITYDSEDENNPLIWLIGNRFVDDVNAQLHISGRASNIKVAFISDPALPEDEVLSRLLFGKELSKISAGQSIQMASVGASVNHSEGLNFLESLRSSFGFDTFELREDELKANNADSGQTGSQALRVGKEFENMKISIDQSIGNTGSKATVSTALGKNVYLDLEVGEKKAGSGVGLSWVFRY